MAPTADQGAEWGRLMAAAQAGDSAAYRQLLGDILPFVRAIIVRQIGRTDEDAAGQDLLSWGLLRWQPSTWSSTMPEACMKA